MSEIKLLPCPFCGGEAMHYGGAGQHCIRCKSCFNTNEKLIGGTLYDAFATPEEAAKDWNTRKPMERIIEMLEEEKDFFKHDELDYGIGSYRAFGKSIQVIKEEGGIE